MLILLVEETTDLSQVMHWQTLSHLAWAGFDIKALVVIVTDCIGSRKSNYHTIHDRSTGYWLDDTLGDTSAP